MDLFRLPAFLCNDVTQLMGVLMKEKSREQNLFLLPAFLCDNTVTSTMEVPMEAGSRE